MLPSVFRSSDLVFNFELPKCERSMGIAFGFLTACLRAHFTNMDCSAFRFGALRPKAISTGLENSLASSKKPSVNSLVRYFLVVPFHLAL